MEELDQLQMEFYHFLETTLCWKDQILGMGIEEVTLHLYREWNSQPFKEKILGVGLGYAENISSYTLFQ
jgi:hypothetical protein